MNSRESQDLLNLGEDDTQWLGQRCVIAFGTMRSSLPQLESLPSLCDVMHWLDGGSVCKIMGVI